MSGKRMSGALKRVLAGGVALAATGAAVNVPSAAALQTPNLVPTLVLGSVLVQENDAGRHVAKIPITLSAPLPSDGWFTFETLDEDSSATAGVDYRALSKRKRIKAGVTSTAVTLPIYGDTDVESSETVEFRISALDTPPLALVQSHGVVRITDDDNDPDGDDGPTVSASSIGFAEGNSGLAKRKVVFGLSEAQTSDVLVTWTTVGDTASPGSDFKPVTKTTRIKAGRVQKTARVTIYADPDVEDNEQLRVVITGVTGGAGVTAYESTQTGLLQVADDDLDSDEDGLVDLAEQFLATDEASADSDGDGIIDGTEVRLYFTDPNRSDTDGDGYSDPHEIEFGSDPNDPASIPRG